MPLQIDPATGRVVFVPDPATPPTPPGVVPGAGITPGQPVAGAPAAPAAPAAGGKPATPAAPASRGVTPSSMGAHAEQVRGYSRGAGGVVNSYLMAPGNFLGDMLGGGRIAKGVGKTGYIGGLGYLAHKTGLLEGAMEGGKELYMGLTPEGMHPASWVTKKPTPLTDEQVKERKQMVTDVFGIVGPFNKDTHKSMYESSPNRALMDSLFMNPGDPNSMKRLQQIEQMAGQAFRKPKEGEARLQTPATVYSAIKRMYDESNANIPHEQRKKQGVTEFPDIIQLPRSMKFASKDKGEYTGSVFLVRTKDGNVRMIRTPHGEGTEAAKHDFFE